MIQDYIQYLTKTLGIHQVILPPQPEVVVLPKVLFVDEKPWSKAATELFQKMREAMKLDPSQIEILFESETSAPEIEVKVLSSKAAVFFTDKNFEKFSGTSKFLTHSPEALIKDPKLKKEAWTVLQQTMAALSSRT